MTAADHCATENLSAGSAIGSSADTAIPLFEARWEVDLTLVRSLIQDVAAGISNRSDWVEGLLYGARITGLNERAAQVVGAAVGREQMIGEPVASFAPPDSWSTLAELIVWVATDRPHHKPRSSPINSFMLNNARLKVWATPGDNIADCVDIAVEGTVVDDRSPWAVRASEARYRRLIHHLPTALMQADARELSNIFHSLRAAGVTDLVPYLDQHPEFMATARQVVGITDANQSALDLIGADNAQSIVGPVDFLFSEAPDAAARVVIARFEGKRTHCELIKLRTSDGRVLDVQMSVTFPAPPERLDVTLISLEDVTERLRTEAQLRQLQDDYSRASRIATLGELATSIAHEVNQPLSAIAMNAETSLRWLNRDEPNLPKVAQLTGRIAESARRASDIVQRIRAMAGRHVPARALLDLNEVVGEALMFVRHDLEARGISLSSDSQRPLPPVMADRVQLQQVIVNLLVNAIQAVSSGASPGAIHLSTAVDDLGTVTFAIRDNGPGVEDENLNRIFDGFFTTKDDGMGIGLAVCQSIVSAHGGTIAVSNPEGGGALFHFALPPGLAPE